MGWRAWYAYSASLVLLAIAGSAVHTQARAGKTLVQLDESSLANNGSVLFQRGVFRVEGNGRGVAPLCIPVQGRWKEVGTQRDCGANPPAEQQREIARFAPDITYLGVRNLGVTAEQWKAGRAGHAPGAGPDNVLSRIGEAFSYSVTANDTRWRFESAKLPQELKADIPGSGIHVHFGGLFSDQRRLSVLDRGAGVEIEVRLAMPVLKLTGKAHSGLTLAVDLDLPTVSGDDVKVPLIVNLIRESDRGVEHVASDGRASYATTWLAPGNRYVESVADPQRTGAFATPERFIMRFTAQTLAQLAGDMNRQRSAKGAAAIDVRALSGAKLSGVTVRNELRFLRQGDVTVEVMVDYLRIARVEAGP